MRAKLQHYFNPLHIYCRLRELRIRKSWAMTFAHYYELVYVKVL